MNPEEIAKLQQELASLKQSVSGMAAERNTYRQELDATKQQLSTFQQQQQETTTAAAATRPAGAYPPHVLSNYLGEADFTPVDQYYQQLMQQQLQQQAAQMRQEFMGNLHLFRSLDHTLGQKDYADLAKYDHPWSQETAKVMQERQLGRPLDGAKSWDQWQYKDPESFQLAADIAQARMFKQQQAEQASMTEAQTNQQAAGLSVGQGAAGQTAPVDMEKLATENPQKFYETMQADTTRNLETMGVTHV